MDLIKIQSSFFCICGLGKAFKMSCFSVVQWSSYMANGKLTHCISSFHLEDFKKIFICCGIVLLVMVWFLW